MDSVLAAASNLLGAKSSGLANYTIESSSTSPSPSASNGNLPSTSVSSKPLSVGLWRVLGARHKVTGNSVSVWLLEKKVLDGIRDVKAKASVVDTLKKEASSLSKLRHPHLLHVVEPLEETRTTLSWVSEPVTGSLASLMNVGKNEGPSSGKASRVLGRSPADDMEIDEVEIQKGCIQLAKALSFLHTQAKIVHLNMTPDSVLVNATGDWKLSGLHMMQSLTGPDGQPTKFLFPEYDNRIPPSVQWNFDYLSPEYALDSTLHPANDLYALGCILYALNVGSGKPPFLNRSSLQTLRTNVESELGRPHASWCSGRKWDAAGSEIKDLLPRLLTRSTQARASLASLPSHPYFSSLAMSTLNFLDPSNFASKSREEKASFLKGLLRVLPGFSERLRKRKILPGLLDECKDSFLIPFLLPLIFGISTNLSKEEFQPVLSKLQPLFSVKDPPQIMLTLLESLPLLEEKTSPTAFRENVMPLIYNSLECDHPPVQQRALEAVPSMCGTLDYGTVENVLLVKVAILFTKTRVLSVKVKTLECFLKMVPILDKSVLTTKLVPLLAKIKTKEPSVMMATLDVHEAMGARVDRAATATLVLPQLWSMSMGSPLLNVDQFGRFMRVIKTLGARVETEHLEHLRTARQLENQAGQLANQQMSDMNAFGAGSSAEVDFESLVNGGGSAAVPWTSNAVEDPWGESLDWERAPTSMPKNHTSMFDHLSLQPSPIPTSNTPNPLSVNGRPLPAHSSSSNSKLKARPIPSASFSAFVAQLPTQSTSAMTPAYPPLSSVMQPTLAPSYVTGQTSQGGTPNYNISLSPQAPAPPSRPAFGTPHNPLSSVATGSMNGGVPANKPPPGWNPNMDMLQPTRASNFNTGAAKVVDWSDFDPIR